MSGEQEYYSNHNRASRFPWSLYHGPILSSLFAEINQLSFQKDNVDILILGPGALTELARIPSNCSLTVADVDQRVLDQIGKKNDPRIKNLILIAQDDDLKKLSKFDLIYAKEVIEHIAEPDPYMKVLYDLLCEGGVLWLSTPNYGFFLLPLLERTALELIAKFDGYSRRHIHPKKYSRKTLQELLERHQFHGISAREVSLKMALVGVGTK